MAAANCSAAVLSKAVRLRPVAMSSTSVSSLPSFGRRRNHLRPKILRTLTKPYPTPGTPIPPPSVPLERLEIPESTGTDVLERDVDEKAVAEAAAVGEESGRVGVECDTGLVCNEAVAEMPSLRAGNFSGKMDMKVGLYAVGFFVLQTVCAVLIFGSSRVSRESEHDESESMGCEKETVVSQDDGRIRKIIAKASALVKVDESVLEERIAEIRAMAREARVREAKASGLKSDQDGFGDDDELDGIQKEVSTRLVRLQKKLSSVQDKSPVALVNNNLNKAEKGSGSSKEVTGSLVFKKKQTSRSTMTTKPLSDVKGFSSITGNKESLTDKNIIAREEESDVNSANPVDLTYLLISDENTSIDVSSNAKHDVDKKLIRKRALELKRRRSSQKAEASTVETNADAVQDSGCGNPVESSKRPTLIEGGQQEIVQNVKNDAPSLNGSSKNGVSKTTVGATTRNKESDENGAWWLHLPCVFAILMRQGSGNEGPGGVYTLKTNSKSPQTEDEAFTVAFEDRGDANNFCYILESFFEDMADFSADIVPLSTKVSTFLCFVG
uniref:Uncharacterized protein n=1 Tax=Kalanchoe fedtschenkoi TaxID=63787 RepID=A0A7N0UIL0_KALFE